jgi:hypothetical protein
VCLTLSLSSIDIAHRHRSSVSSIGIVHRHRPSASSIGIVHRYRPSISPIDIAHRYCLSVLPIGIACQSVFEPDPDNNPDNNPDIDNDIDAGRNRSSFARERVPPTDVGSFGWVNSSLLTDELCLMLENPPPPENAGKTGCIV